MLPPCARKRDTMPVALTFLGAVGTVTGSTFGCPVVVPRMGEGVVVS